MDLVQSVALSRVRPKIYLPVTNSHKQSLHDLMEKGTQDLSDRIHLSGAGHKTRTTHDRSNCLWSTERLFWIRTIYVRVSRGYQIDNEVVRLQELHYLDNMLYIVGEM